jgi:outer membrane protein OmpA-like peptidoglycan-associated protein
MLNSNQVREFKEDQLGLYVPDHSSGRSARQMIAYYNVINVLGDRMGKYPASKITLVGSSEKGPEDGRAMAESIKRYLRDIFSIDTSRIKVEGRDKQNVASAKPGANADLDHLREDYRRVAIESNSPGLLMELQNTSGAPLKPLEITALQKAPLDSYITFNAKGANEAFSSWSVEVMDEKGKVQYFGPYTQERISMPGVTILGARPEADYKVTMVGLAKNGKTVKETTPVHMVMRTPSTNSEGMRFSILYEFDESKAIPIYDKYLTEVITQKIPKGATVLIHGYTDIIGDAEYNENLSWARARDVKSIISDALSKAGRSDVTLETYGFGEDSDLSPFSNTLPEERSYNRTVIIDIIPKDDLK